MSGQCKGGFGEGGGEEKDAQWNGGQEPFLGWQENVALSEE